MSSDTRHAELKRQVLQEQMSSLAVNLGDPDRYLIYLRSKRILDQYDCQKIRAKVTTVDRMEVFVDLMCERGRGSAEKTPFDALVETLKEQSVHAHVGEKLLKALKKAIQEDEEIRRLGEEEESEESEAEATAMPTVEDGQETASHEAIPRGSHTPQLKLHENEDQLTTIDPEPIAQLTGLEYYPMLGCRHGVALIINNKEFSSLRRREGTDRDEENLVQTWRYLGYQVEIRRNCKRDQIMEIFKDMDGFLDSLNQNARDESKVDNDSFVCCLLTHGKKDGIFASDDKSITTDEIEREIGKSKTLKSKPKLFFVQACRGNSAGAEIQSDDEYNPVTNRSDFSYTFATSSGDLSYRNTVKGTWFVTELCKILCKFATCCTLHELQLKLNSTLPSNPEYKVEKFRRVNSHTEAREYTQQPSYAGSMTKCVHFFHSVNSPLQSTEE